MDDNNSYPENILNDIGINVVIYSDYMIRASHNSMKNLAEKLLKGEDITNLIQNK